MKDLKKIIENPKDYAENVSIKKLVKSLQKLSDVYYSNENPLVSDTVYDILLDVLKSRDSDNPFLFQTGSSKIDRSDVELPYFMPSLNKIKPDEKSLTKFFTKYEGPYILSDKLDGISGQLYKTDDGDIDLFTKKRTNVGTSKKHLIKHLFDKKVLARIDNDMSIRGEIIIPKKEFEKVSHKYRNARNTTAGFLNNDKIKTDLAKITKFVAYGILYPRMSFEKQMKKLEDIGIDTVYHEKITEKKMKIKKSDSQDKRLELIQTFLIDKLESRKKKSDYEIDGIVLADNSQIYAESKNNPDYAMAFKMNAQADMRNVKVKEVIWDVSMHCYLNPRLRIETVKVSGVEINYVTAHNAKYIKDNSIGKGSVIRIVRSGDVIPYIVSIIKPSKNPDMPSIPYKWNDTEVDIIAVKPDKNIQRLIDIKRIAYFFKSIGVKYIGEGNTTKLYDNKYNTILKILIAANDKDMDVAKIDGMQKKITTKIYNEIDKKMNNSKLYEVMSGTNIFGRALGKKKIKNILTTHPDILNYTDDKKKLNSMISDVDGFSSKLTKRFISNIKDFRKFYDDVNKYTDYVLTSKKPNKNKKKTSVDFTNQKIVMTGFRSEEISDLIENNGGKIVSSVSKNTTLLIYGNPDKLGSKYDKAQSLNIPIISKDDFMKKYKL
jgi:NAD-dependent DNA ligase